MAFSHLDDPLSDVHQTVVIGGGPAGLTAAYEIQKLGGEGYRPIVLEAGDLVGGIARTESHKGYRFDIGGHRFFTKVPEVEAFWNEIAGDEFLTRPRQSRIYFEGKYFDYPLKAMNALSNLGPIEAVRIMASYARWTVAPHRTEDNLEQWVTNRFGKALYERFFKTYTEKVWGIPCTEIGADWAAQRIKNLSLMKAAINAFTGANDTVSLIEEFQYPRLGPGQMWELCRDRINDAGGEVRMRTAARTIHRSDQRVTGVTATSADGEEHLIPAETVVSSMPLRELMHAFDPPPPPHVLAAADALKYRDFLIVTLVLDYPDPFPDNWIYVHSPDVQVGRIQNFRAWSPDMVPNDTTASIGMEYFCHEGDGLWRMDDADLIALAASELETLGLAQTTTAIDGKVIRQPKAYPVYDRVYRDAVATIQEWIETLENFWTVGRNGLHRYNNQDHSQLTAMLAAQAVVTGEYRDVWNVNVERSYHETFQIEDKAAASSSSSS
ncbi:MAG: NAD(P)/FAD-dependent oxidoreductase [Parvularcula sp.]|jgi:protoporphyrinogen oxidase|nr:NAD(P)/FAD-dependent oxidoreductase [Parvularcula sp.]